MVYIVLVNLMAIVKDYKIVSEISRIETDPISRLLFRMAIPIILAGFVNSLYQLVDAFFITHYVGSLAMAGISFVMPLFLLVYAVTFMISSGGASFVSRHLGAKQLDKAEKMAGAMLALGLVVSLFLTFVLIFFITPIFSSIGATKQLLPFALEYALPYLLAIPVVQLVNILFELLRVEGKIKLISTVMVLSTVLNIILDAVFIVWLEMGVQGASIATVISLVSIAVIMLSYYVRRKTEIGLKAQYFKMSFYSVKQIVSLGLPTFMGAIGTTITIGLINLTLLTYASENADSMVAAYGLIFRVFSFVCAPIFGIAVALQTISGYNFGANKMLRVRQCLIISCIAATAYSLLCALPMIFVPELIYQYFTDDQVLIQHACEISSMVFIGFTTKGVAMLAAPFFQSLGHTKKAFFLSVFQGFVLFVPLILLFAILFGTQGILMAIPIADFIYLLVAALLLIKQSQMFADKNKIREEALALG